MKKALSIVLAVLMIASALPFAIAAEKDTVILYTNDVHCAVEDYSVLAAYRAELISQGKNVIVVDAGDAIQGEIIGSMTKGEAVVDIMSATGYDYAIPGNHEFDYGIDTLLDLAQNKAEYEYISSNFCYLPDGKTVFAPYAIEDFGSCQVAFVGISTPDTVTSSTPDYFKDENGNFIYGFPAYPGELTNEDLYENIQESIDNAVSDGADYVIAVGHAGIIGSNDGWKSSDIIANTDGLDVFIDAHSHETTEKAVYKNKENEDVFLTSTGEKFANFGQLTISGDDVKFELINPDNVDVETMSADAKTAYNTVKSKIDGYKKEIAYLYDEIGTSEAKLVVYGADGSRVVRKRETNAGDFVADAYRAVTGSEVAIANGGGIRADVEAGGVSRKDLMDVNAFNNSMCVLEVTGQQIIDILEHGARKCPEELGSFFQVSGMTFEIHTYTDTPVITNQLGDFIGVDENMERRVRNVCIGGEPVDLDKVYTLTGSTYVLLQGGDGLTMLDGAKIVQQEGLPCDSEMLIKYFTEILKGVIPAEKYGNPDGNGRIKLVEEYPDAPECAYQINYGERLTVDVEPADGAYVKFIPEKTSKYIIRAESDDIDTGLLVYDSVCEELSGEYLDDNEENLDFRFESEFKAGKIYYLNVVTYSDKAETFDIVIECGHSYSNGVCVVCGAECDHSEEGFLGQCECGEVFFGTDLKDGDEFEYEDADGSGVMWLRFVPEKSGVYVLESVSDSEMTDPACTLYDAEGETLNMSDDVYGLNFCMLFEYTAGETYYIELVDYLGEDGYSVSFSRAVHIGDDGSEHEVEYSEETDSDCMTHGYTEGVYCPVCDEYVQGHEEKELDWYHPDENEDEICDLCGAEIDYSDIFPECPCICHSDHWFWSRIWKIVNFFNSLIGRMPVCICGDIHHEIIFYPPFAGLF